VHLTKMALMISCLATVNFTEEYTSLTLHSDCHLASTCWRRWQWLCSQRAMSLLTHERKVCGLAQCH